MESEDGSNPSRIIFLLTKNLFLNRREMEEIPLHHRGGRGTMATMLHHEDYVRFLVTCSPSETLFFFTDKGFVFRRRVSEISEFGRKGIDIREIIRLPEGDTISALFAMDEGELESPDLFLLFATEGGIIKKTHIKSFGNINVNGKIAITLRGGDALRTVTKLRDNTYVCLASSDGRMVKFHTPLEGGSPRFRPSGRVSIGKYGMLTAPDSPLVSASTTLEGSLLFSIGSRGIGKISRLEDFREVSMGRKRGVKAQRTNEKTGPLLACTLVNENDEILLVTSSNRINRFRVSEINVQSPNSMGVILVKMEENERIIAFAKN